MYTNFHGKNFPIYQKIWFKQIYLFLFDIASSKLDYILLETHTHCCDLPRLRCLDFSYHKTLTKKKEKETLTKVKILGC